MFADVAQQVEHFLGKEEASSSNLPISSKKFDKFRLVEFFYPLRKQWYIIECITRLWRDIHSYIITEGVYHQP